MLTTHYHKPLHTIGLIFLACCLLSKVAIQASEVPVTAEGAEEKRVQRFKISVDTGPNHLRSKTLRRFIELVELSGDPSLKVELFESGQLSKDRDIPKALHWNTIEMGVPAQSKLARFVPETNIFTLPIMYGLPADRIFDLYNSFLGDLVNRKIEQKLGVKILGDNLVLGFTSIYTNSAPIRTFTDLNGLKIRIPGGAGVIETFKHLKVVPLALPFSDVPLALAQGNLNGIQSTHETVVSGKLWEVGLKYCYEDLGNLIVYVPMISLKAWQQLRPSTQKNLQTAWRQAVDQSRSYALKRQAQAKETLIEKGILCVQADALELASQRDGLTQVSTKLVRQLGIEASLFNKLLVEFNRQPHN